MQSVYFLLSWDLSQFVNTSRMFSLCCCSCWQFVVGWFGSISLSIFIIRKISSWILCVINWSSSMRSFRYSRLPSWSRVGNFANLSSISISGSKQRSGLFFYTKLAWFLSSPQYYKFETPHTGTSSYWS